ncbi:MAG: HD domain-containing protein [Candidatus Odinarchaeia archaeon]
MCVVAVLNEIKPQLSTKGYEILEDIVNDQKIRRLYQAADFMCREELVTPHDFTHAIRTLLICSKLINLVKETRLKYSTSNEITEEERNFCMLTASYLHDVGNYYNRDFHALSGAMFVGSYLENKLNGLENKEILTSLILHAISEHSPKKSLPTTVESSIVALSDKLDISKRRVAGYTLKTFADFVTDDILEVDLKVKNGLILIEIVIEHPSALYRVEKLKNFLNLYDLINRFFEIKVKHIEKPF